CASSPQPRMVTLRLRGVKNACSCYRPRFSPSWTWLISSG
ncbi:MAG: hypothetical protein AVDCRST_MAG67-1399, partial [uncultured Solirubrobacteraceae bacterium]